MCPKWVYMVFESKMVIEFNNFALTMGIEFDNFGLKIDVEFCHFCLKNKELLVVRSENG